MKVLSRQGHGNSKCFITGNLTCLSLKRFGEFGEVKRLQDTEMSPVAYDKAL